MAATRMPHFREALLILIVIMMIFSSQNVHTFKVLNSRGNLFRGLKENFKISSTNLYAAKKAKKSHPAVPEFSRVLNVGQIPERRPVLCKLLAKDKERAGLALRFDIPEITYFSANVTISRRDQGSILVEGDIEAHIKGGELMEPEVLIGEFDTLLLDNSGGQEGISFDEEMDFDDEVDKNGNIDLGEIAAQYLCLEMF